MWTFPSMVTAANTVLEYGAQATSPTWAFRSNMKSGLLNVKKGMSVTGNPRGKPEMIYLQSLSQILMIHSEAQVMKMLGMKVFHCML